MTLRRGPWLGRLALAATVLIWSTPPVFQYWLSRPFDPWAQNFYRYAAGLVVMAPFFLGRWRRSGGRMTRTDVIGCAASSLPNAVHQVAQTMAVVILWPGIYALLGRLSVVFTVLLALVFFADERWIGRSWRFLVGTPLALAGVVWLVWPRDVAGAGSVSWPGLGLALAAAWGWAFYGIMVKKFTARSGPTVGFGVISFFTVLLLWPLMLWFGDPSSVLRASLLENAVLIGSGVVSIGLGHWLYYVGIRELGAAPAQSALLLCPLGTMVISSALLGETFRSGQILAGVVVLSGAFLALSARPPVVEEPA